MTDTLQVVCPYCDATNRVPGNRLTDAPKCGRCDRQLFSGKPVELTGRNFDRHVSRNDIPLLVDFWAPWCGPCKMMAPALEKAAEQLEPHVRVAKLNTEDEQAIAARFRIQSIPTLVLFRADKEKARHSGAIGATDITRWVTDMLTKHGAEA